MQDMDRPFYGFGTRTRMLTLAESVGTLLFVEIPSIVAAATPGKE